MARPSTSPCNVDRNELSETVPTLIAQFPYVQTAGGAKPIAWVGLHVKDLFTAVPATFAPGRMRTGLSPRAAGALNYSDSQVCTLQFLTRQGEAVGRRVTIVPELDPPLDEPARVDAPPPWFQYEQVALGQDFLQHFWVMLMGPGPITGIYES
jgi:hypothetical protein